MNDNSFNVNQGQSKYCSRCGKENNTNSRFCTSCGAEMINNVNQNSEQVKGSVTKKDEKLIFIIIFIATVLITFFVPYLDAVLMGGAIVMLFFDDTKKYAKAILFGLLAISILIAVILLILFGACLFNIGMK